MPPGFNEQVAQVVLLFFSQQVSVGDANQVILIQDSAGWAEFRRSPPGDVKPIGRRPAGWEIFPGILTADDAFYRVIRIHGSLRKMT